MRPTLGQRGPGGRRGRLSGRRLPARLPLIALIGDTHLPRGARRLPDECRRLLTEAELIVHVGDLTGADVLEELRALGRVAAVHGNMDEPLLRGALPERLVVEAEGLRIGLLHDAGPSTGRRERLLSAFPGCDVVAYGHTHLPEVSQAGEVWILNPGSPTERRRAPEHTMIVLERGQPRLLPLAR